MTSQATNCSGQQFSYFWLKFAYSISTIQVAIQLSTSQSPRIAVASYLLLFAISQPFQVGFLWENRELDILKQYNLTSRLANHKLVSHNCRDQLSNFWPYLSHFKSDFYGKKGNLIHSNKYNLTSRLASHQLSNFWPYLTHSLSDFEQKIDKIGLFNQYIFTSQELS